MKHLYSSCIAAAMGAAASLAALSSPAAAAAESGSQSALIQLGDLDLATQEGRRELGRRVERAAREICDARRSAVGTRIASREQRACIADVRGQLDRRFAQIVRSNQRGG